MPRNTTHTEPVSRNRSQAIRAAEEYANNMRRLDRAGDFTIMQIAQEVVITRNIDPSGRIRHPAITDILRHVAYPIVQGASFEDVCLHWDGDSLSLFFTETTVL